MSLFQCEHCGGIDNTALNNYWRRQREGLPWLCAACDPDIQTWHGYFPQKSAVGYWVDTGGHLWLTPEQAPTPYPIIGQITETEDAQALTARWTAQQED
jgi:hypothetical protein